MLGLLLKRSDKLFINKNTTFNISNEYFFFNTTKYGNASDNRIYGNQSLHVLYTNTSSMRIEMQFDYRNDVMILYRQIAQNMYWVLIGLIGV
jgi:hypothetical protein